MNTSMDTEHTDMIDVEVDPDSVDFQPLFESFNGAAMTALHQQLPDARTEAVSRYQTGRSRVQENQYFSVDLNDTDVDSHSDVGSFSKLRTSLPQNNWKLKLFTPSALELALMLFVLCTTLVLIVIIGGLVFTQNDALNRMVERHTEEDNALSHQGPNLAPPLGTKLPQVVADVFADVDDLPMELMDTAIYWHIPRSAGTTMKHLLATCLGRVITTEVGGMDGHHMDEKLQMIRLSHGIFLNVDTTTPIGLHHAKTMGLAQSKMVDVIFTPYVPEAAVLFDTNHRGRFFTMLREPLDRMISLYYYKRLATWEPNYNPAIKEQTLAEFTQTYGENWMVRTLTGCMSGPLQTIHLNTAKEILRKKFLIGILDEKTESLRRFEEYFGWKFPSPVAQTCKNSMFYFEWHSGNPHPQLEDEAIAKKIRTLNMWDIALYEYGKQLFEEQRQLFWKSGEK